jgi:hypothetical protein
MRAQPWCCFPDVLLVCCRQRAPLKPVSLSPLLHDWWHTLSSQRAAIAVDAAAMLLLMLLIQQNFVAPVVLEHAMFSWS